MKETNSTVDLGYHRVAVNAQGQPLDSDGDGIADYLEDPDGDGFTDPGEYSFTNPVLSLPNSVEYMRGSPPKRLNPAATAYDTDTPNFAGGQLTVWTVIYANANDRLGIHHEGTNATQIGIVGNTLYYGGANIGTFSGGTADTPLVVSFYGYASNAAVQAVLRNITFHNVSSTNALSSRLLQYTLTDGTGGGSSVFQILNIVCAGAIDAMLVIDNSKSLSSNDFFRAKSAASNFVSLLNFTTDRVGLISFAGNAYLDSPLTNNGPLVQSMIMSLTTNDGTRFAPPLDLARTNLTNSATGVMPLVVLLSDGRSGTATGDGTDAEKLTNRIEATNACLALKREGIRLITVAYGTNGGINGGTNLMQWFATSSGDYYYAPDAADIEARYDEIAEGLCRGLTPPEIAITSPANPSELRGPATFRIETKASDSDGFVKRVEFFNGSTSLGVSTNPPFHHVRSLAVGTYSFTAVATDDDNLSTTSSPPVVVTVTNCATNTLVSLTLAQNSVFGGLSTTGYVTISGAAPRGGQTIRLSCTNANVSVPATVAIAEGETNAWFRIDTRSATNELTAQISASLYGSTLSTNLTVYATNLHTSVFHGQCGPMDVAFLVTLSGTIQPGHLYIKQAISNAVNTIQLASGGDYRLALVSFDSDLHVNEQFALTNHASFFSNLVSLTWSDFTSSRGPWDEGLNTIVNSLSDFTNTFRTHARKIVVLLACGPPHGFTGDYYEPGIDDVNAHWRAVEASLKGVEICAVQVLDNEPFFEEEIAALRDVAETTGGSLILAPVGIYNGEGLEIELPHALSRCGADLGEVVFVRDDLRQKSYAGFALNDSAKEVSASDVALFDTTAIDGAITGARFRRSGQLRLNYGSHFDVHLGLRSVADTNLTSLGISLPSAHTNRVAKLYNAEWELPFAFYHDLHEQESVTIFL